MLIRAMTRLLLVCVVFGCGATGALAQAESPPQVAVQDSGPQYGSGRPAGHQGHKWENRNVTLDSGPIRYTLKYSACVDPSHPDSRVFEEGYIGMPGPAACNWYHSGFMFISLNGQEVGSYPLVDMRVTETGDRGGFHMVWDTPDATMRLQFLLRPGANHLDSNLTWVPKPGKTVSAVALRLVCYPSYFTSWNHRQGDRHLITPRLDEREPKTAELDPAQDTYLYYPDNIFDMAKGEGEGPCAMMFLPDRIVGDPQIKSGRVNIGGYAVTTQLQVAPEAKRVRLAFWDFAGKTNAEAAAYLKANAATVQQELAALDFRPEPVAKLDVPRLTAEATKTLAEAGEDAKPYRAKVEGFLQKVADLKPRADAGDWKAEADLANVIGEYTTVMWKVRMQALLNRP